MPMKPLVPPTVNLNGSPAADLIAQRMEVVRLLDAAAEAMALAMPHGRDYQHLIKVGDWTEHRQAVHEAQAAWRERWQMLLDIKKDVMADALLIHRQQRARETVKTILQNKERLQ